MKISKLFLMFALMLAVVVANAEEVTNVAYLYYANEAAAIAGEPTSGTQLHQC